MAQPYVGELRMFAGNFAPVGWMFCEGQQLPISENETLFQLIGTTYGGDGESNFNLPDLRGRVPIHQGNGFILAETAGAEEITLTTAQMPIHTHAFLANTAPGTSPNVQGNLPATSSAVQIYRESAANQNMNPGTVGNTGGSQAHLNMQPFLTLSFCIALQGIFPSPN